MQCPRSPVQRLINKCAQAREFVNEISSIELGYAPARNVWLASTGEVALIAGSGLEWLTRNDRAWVMACVCDYLVNALTSARTNDSPTQSEIEASLLPFLNWLKNQPDGNVVDFCWNVLAFRPRPCGSYVTNPVHWLRRAGRLSGEVAYENIECAIVLADEAAAMYWWPDRRWHPVRWERDSQAYIEFISDSSYLVRAAAAKVLGELFWGCSHTAQGASAPSLPEVMHWVKSQEQRQPGVAGPFLDGSHWSSGELMKLKPEYDFRTWLLETLRTSSREPSVPDVQTLEFYAHEYVCCDPQAIREMLKMGRYELAVLTATEEPQNIEHLRGVLDSMANSDHPGVARAISTYLVERESHAGLGLMSD